MTSLQFLDLSYPDGAALNFSSNFLKLLSMSPSLLELHLSYCNLKETPLSHVLHNLTTLSKIQQLDLSSNQLTGSIPESVSNLKLLQVLDLHDNHLTGPIPESIGRLAALTTLSLGFNKLSGTIPVSIGQLSKLRSLDVSSNSLEGVVYESHFANLSMLEYLDAAYNRKLTFNVSHEWLPPFQLIRIDLSFCQIENGFPQWLQNQRQLQRLELSNTTISGPLPTWLRKMPIIPVIDLSHDNISGPLTNLPSGESGIYSDSVAALFLQNNLFNESIPKSLCKWTGLVSLDLSKNRLTGRIPKCFKNLHYLEFMKLNSNGLSGTVPSFIGNMSSLLSLNLNDNNFRGKLPAEIWNISDLWVLDLGDNALCGKIPESIGEKMISLKVFRLHNNNFTGEIPRSLCKSLKLRVLDVAHNNFIGTVPHCLGKLQGMVDKPTNDDFGGLIEEELIEVMKGISLEYTKTWSFVTNMDLSSNQLVGDIPVELTALCELVGLNLSNNHLSGGIPDHIGNMTALNSLDLSGNKLDGLIPPSISALTFLSHLNLSNNNLSGRIPTGSQLQTLIDPSIYAGNKDLCGSPLPKNCSNHEEPTTKANSKYEATDKPNKLWFYTDITCGFATGFWGVIVVLVLKKRWRRNLFVYAADTIDKIHVAVMVRVNKMKR
ncbi:hypothetical protein M8C21_008163 [Ambrosia artemisiifolia]|uniref:Disease resistance R13L4/SHOC-2-like LRR domain-containing protein n=1 Tax=Ambrosia artemisiifolia TaxID=4212 RepID=A0AAD5CZ87_AMBAR|nr:hypothetical protein M8C21_008163 [Ambrosia artemisiifolia]